MSPSKESFVTKTCLGVEEEVNSDRKRRRKSAFFSLLDQAGCEEISTGAGPEFRDQVKKKKKKKKKKKYEPYHMGEKGWS